VHVESARDAIRAATMARYAKGDLVWWPMQERDAIDIVIGIDRGGGSTKLQVLWINTWQPQASHSSLLLGMYEGPDDYEQMSAAYRGLLAQLAGDWAFPWVATNTEHTDAFTHRIGGDCKHCAALVPVMPTAIRIERINIYYNGDTVALNTAIGSSGHTSCHPCPCCMVHKDALQYDAKRVHCLTTLGAAAPAWRANERHDAAHDAFTHESKGDKKTARHHDNAIRASLFATPLDARIVPPALHIITGIARDLYTHLELICQGFDAEAADNGNHGQPFTSLLQAAAAEHGVYKRPAYGEFSGECAHRMLHNHVAFVDVLSPQQFKGVTVGIADRRLFTSIFERMHTVSKLMLRASPLCDGCIDKLQRKTDGMARDWHRFFRDRALTPKQHMLFVDVPRFARQHRTVCAGE